MTDVYIVAGCRTPIGNFGGSLKDVSPVDLGAVVIREAVRRAGLSPEAVDEVLLGCMLTGGHRQNVARQASIRAGLPVSVVATTVNMACGSGMKTVVEAARAIRCQDADRVVAAGAESMSQAAYVAGGVRWGARMGDARLVDTLLSDGLTDAFHGYHMGVTAENVADQFGISREAMDELALSSQRKAAEAIAAGAFADEIVPVTVRSRREDSVFDTDEYPRPSTAEGLAKLRPAFKTDGRVTAGNASGISDGASALVLASGQAVADRGLTPLAKLIGWGQAGVDPSIMGIGPVEAARRALAMAGLTVADLDYIEGNEAFAAQAVAVGQELGWDWGRVNVHGGAIALGHPVGASGNRIVVTLLHAMAHDASARYGLATLCIGGGMGIATVYEKC